MFIYFSSFIFSLLLSISPYTSFTCDGVSLDVKVINNQNGNFETIKDPQKRDLGAFMVINGGIELMLPRTFINNEISFSDNKWKWLYQKGQTAQLLETKPSGEIKKYLCEESNEN